MSKAEVETIAERDDEIMLFDVLPENYTRGTSYDYYRNFPNLNEEMFYILECATLQNADPEAVLKACKEVLQERNELLLERFNSAREPGEIEIDLEDLCLCKRLQTTAVSDRTEIGSF